ncbi:MAG: xanthine dehydrogenase family protein molybdopterin-binding subunit [Candidatus Binatia bacterium]
MEELEFIGKSLLRPDAREKVRGRTVYTSDLKLPNMLQGRILQSPHAHARIVSIDTQAASKVPGVAAVITGKDYPLRFGHGSVKDTPILAFEKVRYHGEPVAAVAALDKEAAQEALERIRVEYEPLAAVLDPREGAEPEAPVVHPDLASYEKAGFIEPIPGTNICHHSFLRAGDVETGFKASDRIYENTFRIPAIQACPLETHVAIAQVDGSGRVTIWSSVQAPYAVRANVCDALGWEMSRVRVVVPLVGGGFGSKDFPKVEPIAVLLALEVDGKPVRICLDRDEEFVTKVRPRLISVLKTGVKLDGTLVAFEAKLYFDNGAYADMGPAITRNACYAITGPYKVPNVSSDAYCVYTNLPVAGSFRGFGVGEIAWGYETQMDIIAADLGMDSVEFRLHNGLEEGSISATGEVMHSVGLKECLRKVASALDWQKGSEHEKGHGIAAVYKSTGTPSASAVLLKMNEDGTVNLLTSQVDMGQGVKIMLAQIAAEEIGLTPEAIQVSSPDTDLTPYERSTTGSRATFMAGNSTRIAAADLRMQMLELAANLLEAPPGDLVIKRGKIWVKGVRERAISVSQLWEGGQYSKLQYPLLGRGAYSTADIYQPIDRQTGRSGRPTAFWMYCVQGAEIKVDRDTGKIELIRLAAAHDLGKAVNPVNCEGQIEGAVAQGIGITLMEEMVFEEGRLQNTDWTTYRIPTILDVPPIRALIVEAPHPDGPFGAKGLGEPGVAPTPPCIANALFNATGVRIRDLPLTPEKVYWALKGKTV